MKLSTKSTYGLRAMVDIALMFEKGAVPIREIAGKETISVAYLEQLLNRLRRSGLIKSVRGPAGGYVLSKRPERVSVRDIVAALEGTIAPVPCVAYKGIMAKKCGRSKTCVTKAVWTKLTKAIDECLASVTLKDLCDEARGAKGR